MPMYTEWRDLGVPVLYTRFPAMIAPGELATVSEETLHLIETRQNPFVRLLDIGLARIPVGEISAALAALHHPAFRHPLRRALVLVATEDPARPHVMTILAEQFPNANLFTRLEEAEDFIRSEGPRLIREGPRAEG